MNGNKKQSGDWKLIVGGILLIIVLFAAIKFIFWGLEQVIPASASTAARLCPSVLNGDSSARIAGRKSNNKEYHLWVFLTS